MTQYTVIHSRQTLGDVMRETWPQLAGWSESQCLALVDEARSAAPSYVEPNGPLSEWIRYYIESKVTGK